jgi:hypothetical protein
MPTTDSTPGLARVPSACTLPTALRPVRLAEFDTLFRTALRAVHRVSPTQLRLTLDGAAAVEAAARDLTRRESECCSFFAFDFARAGDGLCLDISVPGAYIDVLDALAGRAAATLPARDPDQR